MEGEGFRMTAVINRTFSCFGWLTPAVFINTQIISVHLQQTFTNVMPDSALFSMCSYLELYSKTNEMYFVYSIYYELTNCTCFDHFFFIFRRRCTHNTWYIAWMLCLLAVTRIGVEHQFHSNPDAANWRNTHTIYQVLCVQRLLKMRM
jgi:hypothetical protein